MKKYLLLFLALLLIGMPCCCHGQILRQADPVTGERNIVSMNNTGNRSVKKAFRKQLNPDGARYYVEVLVYTDMVLCFTHTAKLTVELTTIELPVTSKLIRKDSDEDIISVASVELSSDVVAYFSQARGMLIGVSVDGARYYNEKDYYLNADLSDFEQLQVLWNEAEFAEVQQAAVAEW